MAWTRRSPLEEIARRRADLGLSVAALARELGIAESTVWRWERGKTRPSGLALRQLDQTFRRLEQNRAKRLARRASAGPPIR